MRSEVEEPTPPRWRHNVDPREGTDGEEVGKRSLRIRRRPGEERPAADRHHRTRGRTVRESGLSR
ncbi:hypothetical protein GCM10010495_75190 [Kitasatospora herbaricolor]|nr:hypothetical protein GCM10010495_75190 [Kitasatospora herbaricolor]